MPGTEKRFGFEEAKYAATPASHRFASRQVRHYHLDAGRADAGNNLRLSGFALHKRLDGQSLAGSGALVFEGELLESPRH